MKRYIIEITSTLYPVSVTRLFHRFSEGTRKIKSVISVQAIRGASQDDTRNIFTSRDSVLICEKRKRRHTAASQRQLLEIQPPL